jgi:hypothetical protein
LASSLTVRDRVKAAQREIRDGGELVPSRATQLLMELTALLGNCAEEIRAADSAYATVLLRELESSEKANRAKIRAETSEEYERKRQARDTKELVYELISSLKYLLRAQAEEMRLAR